MSVKVLVPIANGTEDVECTTIIDLLRRADIEVTVAGTDEQVQFARGLKVIADTTLDKVDKSDVFDAIVIPGGMPGVTNLMENDHLKEILSRHNNMNKNIGAICAAPIILDNYKLLKKDSIVTSYPSFRADLSVYNYSEKCVVMSDNFITSRGIGTAIDFVLKLIEILLNKNAADKVAKDIVYKV